LIKELRASGERFALVDSGDALFGSVPERLNPYRTRQYVEKAKVIIEAYNHMGYQAMAVGDTELGIGLERLKALESRMRFPLLCANLRAAKTGKLVFKPSAVLKVGDLKIGVFAVIMNTLDPRFLKRVAPGVRLEDCVSAAVKEAEALRPKVDLVVGLLHANDDEIAAALKATKAIDVVIGPRCHNGNHEMWISEDRYMLWVEGRPVLSMDGQGSRLGRFEIALGPEGPPFISWDAFQAAYEKKEAGGKLTPQEDKLLADAVRHHLCAVESIPIFPHYAEAPEIKALVDRFKQSTRFESISFEQETKKAKERYLTAETCKKCHEENYKKWRETPHGRAYATLEKTGDQYRYDCLPCHSLGYGEAFLSAHKVGPYKNVQCENCHGTEPRHPDDPETFSFPKVSEIRCLVCHNPKHLGEPFDFAEMVHKETCCKVPLTFGIKKPSAKRAGGRE